MLVSKIKIDDYNYSVKIMIINSGNITIVVNIFFLIRIYIAYTIN